MAMLLAKLFSHCDRELPEEFRSHREAARALDRKAPLAETDFVVFDTELTGLNFKKDTLISIGAIKMKGSRILPGRTFYRLVKPESELNSKSVVVHELTHTDLEKAEDPSDVLRGFMEFVGGAILVGHFVYIDINFVNRSLKKHFGATLQSPAVDTSVINDWLYDNDSAFKRHFNGASAKKDLFTVASKCGITVQKTHNAFYDAYLTAQLFQRFLHFLTGCGIDTVDDLLAVGKP